MHQQFLFLLAEQQKEFAFCLIMFLAAARELFILSFVYAGEVIFLLFLLVSCLLRPIIVCVQAVGHFLADLVAVAYTIPTPDFA